MHQHNSKFSLCSAAFVLFPIRPTIWSISKYYHNTYTTQSVSFVGTFSLPPGNRTTPVTTTTHVFMLFRSCLRCFYYYCCCLLALLLTRSLSLLIVSPKSIATVFKFKLFCMHTIAYLKPNASHYWEIFRRSTHTELFAVCCLGLRLAAVVPIVSIRCVRRWLGMVNVQRTNGVEWKLSSTWINNSQRDYHKMLN